MTIEQQSAFQQRLQRIAPEGVEDWQEDQPRRERSLLVKIALCILMVCQTFFSGLLVLFLVSALRANLFGWYFEGDIVWTVEDGGTTWFALDIALAALACWALNKFYGMTSVVSALLQQSGVIVMAVLIHNFAFWAPYQMSIAMTGDWVRIQQLYATPNAVNLGGYYIRFNTEQFDYAPASFVTPKVIYRN